VTGVQPDLKATLRSEAALKGLSLSEYFLDLALDGRIVQKRVRAKAAEAEAIFVTRSSREAERRKGGA
jgi:hypothetical protein